MEPCFITRFLYNRFFFFFLLTVFIFLKKLQLPFWVFSNCISFLAVFESLFFFFFHLKYKDLINLSSVVKYLMQVYY